MKRILAGLALLFPSPVVLLAEEQVNVFPQSSFDRSIIYIDLALFWIAIIVLVVLIRFKLREIERTQAMVGGVEEEKIPMLE